MNQEKLKELLSKYLSGASLTEEELEQLRLWDTSFENAPRLTEQLSDLGKDRMRQRMWEHIDEATTDDIHPMRSPKKWLLKIAVAASLVIAIGTAWLIIGRKDKHKITSQQLESLDIIPGGNKAILTLADGTVITLDSAKNGMLAQQGNATIMKLDDGRIAYNTGTEHPGAIAYNTITTPDGGQYVVILPDGSKVMLNAGSSLRYPSQFGARERRVTLTGEGYFEVTHNEQQPFIVSVNDMEVHDLGTEFNINAYLDEPFIQTTLVSGLAEVRNKNGQYRLQPGKAALVKDGKAELVDANLDAVTAWRKGLFVFDGLDINAIMRQVARWYDVDIAFDKQFSKRFYGTISRDEPVSKVFNLLEMTNDVHFKVNGRKITVQP